MRYLFLPLVLLLIPVLTAAQEPVITPDMQVDSATLHQWLHSGDPRLVAWAADFARRNHDAAIIAELPDWLEHTAIPGWDAGDERQQAQRRAVVAALDALIQENAKVPIPAIRAVSSSYIAQAAILISRHSFQESELVLYDWFAWGDRFRVRIANMIFAKDPTHVLTSTNPELSFVGGIVADSESELQVRIATDSEVRAVYGGAACGDGGGYHLPPGWPTAYTYELVENEFNANGPVIIDLDGDRIASRRRKENDGWGSCSGVAPLDAYTRHRLIAYWLGVKPQDMSWQPQQPVTIRWTGRRAYERDLARLIEAQRQKLRATSDELRARGILQGLNAVPKLVVNIQCDIQPCPLQ